MNALKLVREVDRQINNGELSYEEGVELLNPLFDVEPVRHGHWIAKWNQYDKDGYVIRTIGRCSCCNQSSDVLDYCGNCGAKMDE